MDWTGDVEDGILLPGGTMDAAEIMQGGSVPDDDDFSANSPSGKHYEALGTWTDNNGSPRWNPAGCGSFDIEFCNGQFR